MARTVPAALPPGPSSFHPIHLPLPSLKNLRRKAARHFTMRFRAWTYTSPQGVIGGLGRQPISENGCQDDFRTPRGLGAKDPGIFVGVHHDGSRSSLAACRPIP